MRAASCASCRGARDDLAAAAVRVLVAEPSRRGRALTLRDAERLGAVGPAARAAGLREDVRTDSPRLSYGGFDRVVAQPAKGDVGSRMAQRAVELEQSLALLDESLTHPLLPGEAILPSTAAPRSGSDASKALAGGPSA